MTIRRGWTRKALRSDNFRKGFPLTGFQKRKWETVGCGNASLGGGRLSIHCIDDDKGKSRSETDAPHPVKTEKREGNYVSWWRVTNNFYQFFHFWEKTIDKVITLFSRGRFVHLPFLRVLASTRYLYKDFVSRQSGNKTDNRNNGKRDSTNDSSNFIISSKGRFVLSSSPR